MKKHSTEMAVIKALKEIKDGYISGEVLAEKSSVSRAAIWKHIKSLRENGYEIQAVPKMGYKLISSPNALLPEEIMPALETESFGKKIVYRKIINSTNSFAKELAENGADEGTIIIAEEQNQGKGRLNRSWASPIGGIWLSIILRPQMLPIEAVRFTLLAAIAVAKAIENLGIKPEIKWPNDILIDGKKVCGILLELSAEMDRIDYLIAGFGINANFRVAEIPEESRGSATTLYEAIGRDVNRHQLVADLLLELEKGYWMLLDGGWNEIRDQWLSRCGMLNKTISLSTLQGIVEGEFIGVDEFGAIRMRLPQGDIRTFSAGDVTVKK